MAKHSSIVGGSTAARLLNCPGSYQATVRLPPSADISSVYAEEGTFAHEVMSWAMRGAAGPNSGILQGSIGMHFHDRVLTRAHVDEMLQPALDALNELLAEYGFKYDETDWPSQSIEVEKAVLFPGVRGAFGTCDVLLRAGDHVFLVDWKFGSGIPVRAVYQDQDGDLINPQLMFYAAAALNSAKHIFRGAKVLVLAIIQPRTDAPLTHTTVSRRDIKRFREDVLTAVDAALDYDPPRQKGEWCRFAPCKINCPLWTGPLLELAALMGHDDEHDTAPINRLTPYGAYLSAAKRLIDHVAMFKKEIDEQLHSFLTDGGIVPGWRLKSKVKQRKWIENTDKVEQVLLDLGFEIDEIFRSELQTFAAADATAKRLGVKIPDELRVAPPSNETTIAPTDDPAPVVDPARAVEAVREALLLLK
jgi:hypothetical protein